MKGKIKAYLPQKGYGFIVGEDNNDYFFHISNIAEGEDPCVGMSVSFSPETGEKGLVANKISVTEATETPKFIILGKDRIRLSNIKRYRMDERTGTFAKKADGMLDLENWIEYSSPRYYLHVETFQGEDFTYDSIDIDVKEKLKELDGYLCK